MAGPPSALSVLGNDTAFTLLEVMIAIAIIAIAFTSLFGSQSYSLSLAAEAKFNSTASFLAQEKLAEYESGLAGFVNDEGDFGEEFPAFRWKVEVQDASFDDIEGLNELERPVQRIDLTITWADDQYSTTLTYYGREKIE
jgi:general secretion pathway protein I